jgi:hypothetical protein
MANYTVLPHVDDFMKSSDISDALDAIEALPLAGGTMSGTLNVPTIQNLLNTDLVIDAYNDDGAGTHNYFKFNPYGGSFEMPDNSAGIIFENASAIREAGEQGLEIECSVGYRWQWVAGRMILRMVNSGQIARILAIDGIVPAPTDDINMGFVSGSRWETADGTVYICTDSSDDAAVWEIQTNADLPEILTPSSALTISPLSGTYAEGYKHTFYITPTGSAQTLDFSGIAIPSDSVITLPKSLEESKLYIVQITYYGGFWMLTSVVGGYSNPD